MCEVNDLAMAVQRWWAKRDIESAQKVTEMAKAAQQSNSKQSEHLKASIDFFAESGFWLKLEQSRKNVESVQKWLDGQMEWLFSDLRQSYGVCYNTQKY